MKILHVAASVWKDGGGTSEVVPRLARAQKQLGHDVAIAVAHIGEISLSAESAIAAGVRYYPYPRLGFLRSLALSPAFCEGVRRLIAEADMIHIHGLWQAPGWYTAYEARRQGKPYVVMPHGFLEPARLVVSKWKKRIASILFERRILSLADGLVATTEAEVNGFRQFGLKTRAHIMPIGVDIENFDEGCADDELLKRIGADAKRKHLLYLSRITPIKGLDLLHDAWTSVKNEEWQLLIVGPDDRGYVETVKSQYAHLVSEGSVVIHGPLYGREKYDLLKSVDAFVLPTRNENWSIAVAEALASGLPVICTRGAPWECINNVGAGAWTAIDKDAIASGIKLVFDADEDERAAMGGRGRRWVIENLSWPTIANEIVAFYEDVLARYTRQGTR